MKKLMPFVADAPTMHEGISRLARAWGEYRQTLGQRSGRVEVIA